jgi:KipI family sensor histidine kinase inhibitor
MAAQEMPVPSPTLGPLGDRGLLVRFGSELTDEANRAAIALAQLLRARDLAGVDEVAANLISVLVRYDPARVGFEQLAGEVRLVAGAAATAEVMGTRHAMPATFGGDAGPDLATVAALLDLSEEAFVAAHNGRPLRVLATGFAPGFVYCGLHAAALGVPRRDTVRSMVPAGTLLFAARQTAIAATAIPTGWHVIGRTSFNNFDPAVEPPTRLREGDEIVFEAAS